MPVVWFATTADTKPTGFLLCTLVDGNELRPIANFVLMNRGLHATAVNRISIVGLDAAGKQYPLVGITYAYPAEGEVNVTSVAYGKPHFDSYLQPGEKVQGLLLIENIEVQQLLQFVKLTARFDPVLGESSAISIGSGNGPISQEGLDLGPNLNGGCYGTLGEGTNVLLTS